MRGGEGDGCDAYLRTGCTTINKKLRQRNAEKALKWADSYNRSDALVGLVNADHPRWPFGGIVAHPGK